MQALKDYIAHEQVQAVEVFDRAYSAFIKRPLDNFDKIKTMNDCFAVKCQGHAPPHYLEQFLDKWRRRRYVSAA